MWKAATVDSELNRLGTAKETDDSSWHTLPVPGHWSQDPNFRESNGPVLYRKTFNYETNNKAQDRTWLTLEGMLSQAEIWLNDHYLGSSSTYFASTHFDVTNYITAENNVLAIEISCPQEKTGQRAKRSITGSLQTGLLAPPTLPGGIWKNVRLQTTGPSAIKHGRVLCTKANENKGELALRLVLDAQQASENEVITKVYAADNSLVAEKTAIHMLASGENRFDWQLDIEQPKLWWPAALGSQPLYRVEVTVVDTASTAVSDQKTWRIGFREITNNKFLWTINGERLFVKGIASGPKQYLADVDEGEYINDIKTVKDSGLDMLRIYGHISDKATYDAADEMGVLLWQDLPFVGGYATGVRSKAKEATRLAVDFLGNHPSVALWCCSNLPNDEASIGSTTSSQTPRKRLVTSGRHFLPTWNKSVLSSTIKREISNADSSRPIVHYSGSMPSPFATERSDAHLWLGWRSGNAKALDRKAKQWPRLVEFPGGIGSQSVQIADWGRSEPSWVRADLDAFATYVPRSAYPDGVSWAHATRNYQAELLKSQIETLRRLKYSPTGGFCVFALNDSEPQGGYGIFDTEGNAKPGYDALVDACRPVIVVATTPPQTTYEGQKIALDIHAVNDQRTPVGQAQVQAQVSGAGWLHRQVWQGSIGADTCDKIGTLAFSVPAIIGTLTIDVELVSDELAITNRYHCVVIPAAES